MGANVSVRPGSSLTLATQIGDTQITVLNAGVGGLNYSQGDSVRILGLQNASCQQQVAPVDETLNDANTDATVNGNTVLELSATTSAALAGSVVSNLTAAALVENTDFVVDYVGGNIRFLSGGSASEGETYAFGFNYRRASGTEIRLGQFLPIMEFSLRLEHSFPDGRTLKLECPRAAITPDNPSLNFDDADWIGTDMNIEVLASSDPQYANKPFGTLRIDNSTASGQELTGYNPDTYSVGSFKLYITPIDAGAAQRHGFGTGEIDVGNVRVGSIEAVNEYLRHYAGTPRVKDKVVLLQKELNVIATIENLNSQNLALIFDGERAEDAGTATYAPQMALVTVPDLTDADVESQWISVPFILLDPA